jgi:replicative DNA helicase
MSKNNVKKVSLQFELLNTYYQNSACNLSYTPIFSDEEGYDLRGVLRVIVAKNTYGPTGEFRLKYDKEKGQVTDIDTTRIPQN